MEKMMIDIKNQKFGKLTAIKRIKKDIWECHCDCGATTTARTSKLRCGHKRSCGCLIGKTHIHKTGKNHHKWCGYEGITGTFWRRILTSAKKRNYEVKITIEDAWDLFVSQKGKCAISGINLYIAKTYKEKNLKLNTASLDRIDSSKGYIPGNIQWIHTEIQFMKQEFEQKLFLDWCKKIYEFNRKKI